MKRLTLMSPAVQWVLALSVFVSAGVLSRDPRELVAQVSEIFADVDGDGLADLTYWRPDSGMWYMLKSSTSFANDDQVPWGTVNQGDRAVPGEPVVYTARRRSGVVYLHRHADLA